MSDTTPAAEEEDAGGGWGLSSVTAAFGGWGLEAEPTAAGTPTAHEDDEWRRNTRDVEEAAASAAASAADGVMHSLEGAEDAFDETAKMAAEAASSFFSGASSFFGATSESDNTATAAPAASQSGGDNPDTLSSILQYNPLNSLASQWINDLEKQSNAADPHRGLRDHLTGHLKDWPQAVYEEWVEDALVSLEGWSMGSAVVDDTFYAEGNVHRNLWNERMAELDEDAGEDGETGARKRRYVPARTKAQGSGAPASNPETAAAATEGNEVAKASPTVTASTSALPKSSAPQTTTAPKKETTVAAAPTDVKKETGTSSAVLSALDILDDDHDLDALLADDDGEICFVSPPSSGSSGL